MRRIYISLLPALLILTGCGVSVAVTDVPEPAGFVTASLPATGTPYPTLTSLPPSPVPTTQPLEGVTIMQIHVRTGTSSASKSLGIIAQFSPVQVLGQDSSKGWYQISYTNAPEGTGWVRSEYIQVNAQAEIPVIQTVTSTGAGVNGSVLQKINVRSGPGTTFNVLGELNPKDVVFISGLDESKSWAQIEFMNGPDGKGWAALQFLNVESTDSLTVLIPSSPTPAPQVSPSPFPMVEPGTARLDEDSEAHPLFHLDLSPSGSLQAQISDEISWPDGDLEDWIRLQSTDEKIVFRLMCASGVLKLETTRETENPISLSLACNTTKSANIFPHTSQMIRVKIAEPEAAQRVDYRLTIESIK